METEGKQDIYQIGGFAQLFKDSWITRKNLQFSSFLPRLLQSH